MYNVKYCPVCDAPMPKGSCRIHGKPLKPVDHALGKLVDHERGGDAPQWDDLPKELQKYDEESDEESTGPVDQGGGFFHSDIRAVKARKRHDRVMQNTPVVVVQPNPADALEIMERMQKQMLDHVDQRLGALPAGATRQLEAGEESANFCTQCGNQLDAGQHFCANCGTKLKTDYIDAEIVEDDS